MKPLLVAAGVLFQVAIERVHSVGTQEIGPPGPGYPALRDQVGAQARLVVAGPEKPGLS